MHPRCCTKTLNLTFSLDNHLIGYHIIPLSQVKKTEAQRAYLTWYLASGRPEYDPRPKFVFSNTATGA